MPRVPSVCIMSDALHGVPQEQYPTVIRRFLCHSQAEAGEAGAGYPGPRRVREQPGSCAVVLAGAVAAHRTRKLESTSHCEVIKLMVNLLLSPEWDLCRSQVVKAIFDPACGTGGMLSVAEKYIRDLNSEANPLVFGQDLEG
jgi:hypothetical protein